MDRDKAESILRRKMLELKSCSYRYFELMIERKQVEVCEVTDAECTYQIEVSAYCDADQAGAIWVVGSIDDGGMISAIAPLTQSVLLLRDGEIVD